MLAGGRGSHQVEIVNIDSNNNKTRGMLKGEEARQSLIMLKVME